MRGPKRNISVALGQTLKIECQASGFPVPFINWRLNWGHVCEEPRCSTTNYNGVGILTIVDVRLSDAGAYSCEALNSRGRVFAVPDAIVYVQERQSRTTPSPPAQYKEKCDPDGSYTQEEPCYCKVFNKYSISFRLYT